MSNADLLSSRPARFGLAVLGLALLGSVSLVSTAAAQVFTVIVERDDPVVNQIKTLDDDITKAFSDALKKHAEQGTAGFQTQTEAQARLADAQSSNNYNLFRSLGQSMFEGGQYDPSPSMCQTTTSLPSSSSAVRTSTITALTSGTQTGASPNPDNPVAGAMSPQDAFDDQRNWERGNNYSEVQNGVVAISKKIIDNRTKYANAFPGVLDPTTDARSITDQMGISNDAGSSQQQALSALAKNLISPMPPQPLQASQAATPEGMVETARREVIRARRSTSYAIYEHLLGEEMLSPGLSTSSVTFPSNYTAPSTSTMSPLQWMDVQVWSKYMSPEWYEKTLSSSPAAVNREVAIVNALNALVNWKRYLLERKMALLQAAMFAHELDKDTRVISPN